MSFLVLLWMVILGIALLVYLGIPIFSKTGSQLTATSDDFIEERRRTLFQERERSYAALADLDEDYETGKLSDATTKNCVRNSCKRPHASSCNSKMSRCQM